MLLTKQVVQVQNICQRAVTTWTISRRSFYVKVMIGEYKIKQFQIFLSYTKLPTLYLGSV